MTDHPEDYDDLLVWLGDEDNNLKYKKLEKDILDSGEYDAIQKYRLFSKWLDKDENKISLEILTGKIKNSVGNTYFPYAVKEWATKNIKNIKNSDLETLLPLLNNFHKEELVEKWVASSGGNPTEKKKEAEKLLDNDTTYAKETIEKLKEKKNLRLGEIALILSEKHLRNPAFYAPVLELNELTEFVGAFNKHTNIFPDIPTEQSFVIRMERHPNAHWGACALKSHNNKLKIFIFEPLAELSHIKNNTYIKNIIAEFSNVFSDDDLTTKINFDTNYDKLQSADPINCGAFSIEFVFNLINQENLRGQDLFTYSYNNPKELATINIDGLDIQITASHMEPRLIRSMQSISRIEERLESEKEATQPPVNKKGEYMKAGHHPHAKIENVQNVATGIFEKKSQNKRIQYKRKKAVERVNTKISGFSQAEIKEMSHKSTLSGYNDYVDDLAKNAPAIFNNVSEAVFFSAQKTGNQLQITPDNIRDSLLETFHGNPDRMKIALNIQDVTAKPDSHVMQSNKNIQNIGENLASKGAMSKNIQDIIKNSINASRNI